MIVQTGADCRQVLRPRVGGGDVFSNLAGNEQYYLNYMPEVGSLTVVHISEPTTATLSLLARIALAARCRRE